MNDSHFTRFAGQVRPGQLWLNARLSTPWGRQIELRAAIMDGAHVTAAMPVTLQDQDEEGQDVAPFLTLGIETAQSLMDQLRHGNPPSDHIPEFSAVEEELADTIIRIMDFGLAHGYRVAEALVRKHEFNRTRPHMHGGKKF